MDTKYFKFIHKKKIYYISILEPYTYKNINNDMDNNLNYMYKKCFNNTINSKQLYLLTENNGVNIIIYDEQFNHIFLATFIKNRLTNNIEMYNICKDFDNKISSSYILNIILNLFIKKKLFSESYSKIILSVIISNKYFIPAVFCYQNIGFKYNNSNKYKQLININEPFIQMYLNISDSNILSKQQKIFDFVNIIDNYFNTQSSLFLIYYNLTKHYLKKKYTKKYILNKIIEYLNNYYV